MQGIYKISCLQDSRVYIGSSNNIQRRWSEHTKALSSGNHRNSNLQEDWDAYGDESFIFMVIEETKDLIDKEQFYLDQVIDNCYNISLKVTNPMSNPEVVIKQQKSLDTSGKRGGQKLKEEQVFEIVKLLNSKHTATYVANKYNVSTSLIAGIACGSKWTKVTNITGLPTKQKRITDKDITQIKLLLLSGKNNTDIAKVIGVSYSTIRTYINRIKSENV